MTVELVKKEPAELAVIASNFFDDQEIPTDKLRIPRINLMQPTSDGVTDGGAALGTYQNNITKDNYGVVFSFIPIKFKFGAVYFTQDKGLVCKSIDGITSTHGDACKQCPFGVFYKNWKKVDGKNKPADCAETVEVMGIETTTMTPCVLSFKSTSYGEGTKLATSCKLKKKLGVYKIGSVLQHNEKNQKFFIMNIKAQEEPTNDQIAEAIKWKENFATQAVEIHEDSDAVEYAR